MDDAVSNWRMFDHSVLGDALSHPADFQQKTGNFGQSNPVEIGTEKSLSIKDIVEFV